MTAIVLMWIAIIRLSVFSTKLSAFALVCSHVLTELGRFLIALAFILLTFGCAIVCLRTQVHTEYKSVLGSMLALFAVTVGVYEKDYREFYDEEVLMVAVLAFIVASAIILMNLLIAQLNCSYEIVYADMVGFARMQRACLIVETLSACPKPTWVKFTKTLRLDKYLEFNEGDVGLAGGIQLKEAAGVNPTTQDAIMRFGGATDVELPWPEEHSDMQPTDRCERLSALLRQMGKQISKFNEGQAEAGQGRRRHAGSRIEERGRSKDSRGSVASSADEYTEF